MTFYGPTFPNETHYETLFNGRQRFGNRSANMFFVRPARHIACPRRLKYIQDIKTGYIPYVEDSSYPNRPSYKHVSQKTHDNDMNKSNGFGLYNSADAWCHELMELAQQVKTSLIPSDEQEQSLYKSRSSRLSKPRHKRSNSSVSNYISEQNDEQNITKRILHRRACPSYQRSPQTKSKPSNDKSEQEQSTNDENQDPGIWLIPILCYILQIDNIFEAQEWLVNANPTEKRLAMELISRTMQDMQTHDTDLLSDISTSDLSSVTAPTATANLNNVYWPYKIWQRQEKDRQQQHQIQNFVKQSKLSSYPSLPSLTVDNGDTCERATSPLRILTPAKRLLTRPNHTPNPIETTVIARPPTRNTNDRTTPSVVIRQNQNPKTNRPTTAVKRSPSRISTPRIINGNDRLSRRSYRVTTSLHSFTDDDTNSISSTLRGKTPLI